MITPYLIVLALSLLWSAPALAVTTPTLPTATVDTAMPTVTGTTYNATCATLQSTLNTAAAANVNLTHEIILATGTTCTGPYKLPSHTGGTGWILIKGPNYASLPAAGTRVAPSDAALMPELKYGEDGVSHNAAISAQTGAQRYRLIGLSIVQDSALSPNWALISTGYNNQAALNTGYILIDRCVIRDTDTAHETRRGVFAEAEVGHIGMIDSYLSGIKDIGNDNDTQAWLSINNAGPILLRNNYLQASGENVMFGGGAPASEAVHPADITIQRNTLNKDPAWWGAGTGTCLTSGCLVKALLELKAAKRVLIEGNDFLDMPYNDGGSAFRLTARAEANTFSFVEVSDLTIQHNLGANITNWVQFSFGSDDNVLQHTKHSQRWMIHNNLIYGLGWLCGGGAACGVFYSISGGGDNSASGCTDYVTTCKNVDITITHNTVDDIVDKTMFVYAQGQEGLNFSDNLINDGGTAGTSYGIYTTTGGNQWGTNLLNWAWGTSAWTFANNRIACCSGNSAASSTYPQGTNSYPTSYTNFQWTNRTTRDYTLQGGSPAIAAASDGTNQGVNFTAYNAARNATVVATSVSGSVSFTGAVGIQ